MKVDVAILLKVIHKKCLDCCGGSRIELQRCNMTDCPLHKYRAAKNVEEESGE